MKKRNLAITSAILGISMLISTNAYAYPMSKHDMSVAPFVGDFNGDGRCDFGIKTAAGELYIAYTDNGGAVGKWDEYFKGYGGTDGYPLTGDFDGDGKDDFAIRTLGGEVWVDYAKNGFGKWDYHNNGYGGADATPFVGDFNGDGRDDIGIRNYSGDIYVAFTNAGGAIGQWDYHNNGYGGGNDYVSFVGDFNGDGKDDFGFKTNSGEVYVAFTDADGSIGRWDYHNDGYGGTDAYPIVGDFNGDGKDDLGIKTDGGEVWIAFTDADGSIGRWDYHASNYGMTDSYPIVGDFNGDGKDDFGVKTDGGDLWIAFTDADGSIGKYDYHNTGYGINTNVNIPSKSDVEIKREKVVNKAKQYLGVPYVWGGTSPSGFDCSGLTQYVYRNSIGVEIGRSTYDQIKSGREVSYNELQPGDLVFPHSGHVGIYVGNGQMIHAPQTGDVVKIAPIYKFWRARRIIG